MKTMNASEARGRFRLIPRFGVRSLLLLTLAVALLMIAIPWLERSGKIAYCGHYDMGKTSAIHFPALGSASCVNCHLANRHAIRPWITLSPEFRMFSAHVGSKVDHSNTP